MNAAELSDGLGWRAKIGVLVPATNTIAQPEYEGLRPWGVTNHVARMAPSTRSQDIGNMDAYRRSLERDTRHVRDAIDQVLPAAPQGILLGHSIDTFRGGIAGAEQMRKELEDHSRGIPVFLPAQAFVGALRALGLGRRIAAVTPYWPPGDEQVARFFTDAGYTVTEVRGLCCRGPLAIAATPLAQVRATLRELARTAPDVIVQPGTNLPTVELAVEASRWLGIPVLSCNAVSYWYALRGLGIRDHLPALGPIWEGI